MNKRFSKTKLNMNSLEMRFNLFETFFDANPVEQPHYEDKYKNKQKMKIIETLLFDNGQLVCWLFTDKNGYVMRKSQKKLTKDYVVLYFINKIRKKYPEVMKSISDEKIMGDLNKFSTLIDQKNYSKKMLFAEPSVQYLLSLDKIRFLLVNNVDDFVCSYKFFNIIEFFKLLNENGKVNNVNIIQNFIDVQTITNKNDKDYDSASLSKDKVRLLTSRYTKETKLSMRKIDLFLPKPKILIDIDSSLYETKKKRFIANISKKNPLLRKNSLTETKILNVKEQIDNELVLINNETLLSVMTPLIDSFIKSIEKKKYITITEAYFTFARVNDDSYAFHFGEFLNGASTIVDDDIAAIAAMSKTKNMNDIIKKKIPSGVNRVKMYERITNKAFCFGEFCEYKIPKEFKNLKKNIKIEEINKNIKIPNENKFTNRDKNHNLPYFLPVFQIKKAYDNPMMVNIVLKAYSIFPKNFDKEEEIARLLRERKEHEEKKNIKNTNKDLSLSPSTLSTSSKQKTVSLYTPTPNKFSHINYDEMYVEKNVCENCFKIYTLISNFLSHIDENSNELVSFSKAKDLLLKGENLKPNAFDDASPIALDDNLLFQEEVNEISLKKILKKKIMSNDKINYTDDNITRTKKKIKILRQGRTRKDDMNKIFSYKLNINPKLLKLNLIAEKTKNKFFKLIFNELRTEPESLYQKLCLSKNDNKNDLSPTSMKVLRMHMGINSHVCDLIKDSDNDREAKRMEIENTIKENSVVDIDIFLVYKNLLREENTNIRNVRTTNAALLIDNPSESDESNRTKEKKKTFIEEISNELNSGKRNELPMSNSAKNLISIKKRESFTSVSMHKSKKKLPYLHRRPISSRDVKMITNDIFPKKKITEEEKQKKIEMFVHISPKHLRKDDDIDDINNEGLIIEDKKSKKKKEKKIQVTSIFYDKNFESKNETPYYYMTTPLPKFNEGNIAISQNPLKLSQSMTISQYITIGKFKRSPSLLKSNIFVYDSSTAVPYEVLTVKSKKTTSKYKRSLSLLSSEKSNNVLFVFINDFFDDYISKRDSMYSIVNECAVSLSNAKCVFFNLPGQATTMFARSTILNNEYYAIFLDRFLYFLYAKKVFDPTYKVVLIGFGNGGQIALTYTSFYERYWDMIHTVIMFNGYCDNDSFINQSMVELMKVIKRTKNTKLIEFFIKSVTVDPQSLINYQGYNSVSHNEDESDSELESSDIILNDDVNTMTLVGYHNITKGYFFNVKINHKEINTKIVAVHSNQNCFISINNINALFMNKIKSYTVTKKNKKNFLPNIATTEAKETKADTSTNRLNTNRDNKTEYEYTEMTSTLKRKLIVIDGAHEVDSETVRSVLCSYVSYVIENNILI